MSATLSAQPKRHKRPDGRVEGRRGRDPDSSQDASEEDNDASDVGSLISVNAPSLTPSASSSPRLNQPAAHFRHNNNAHPHTLHAHNAHHHHQNSSPASMSLATLAIRRDKRAALSETDGLESPTYDGDIDSSSTIGTPIHANYPGHQRRPSSPTPTGSGASPMPAQLGRAPTPKAARGPVHEPAGACVRANCDHPCDVPVADSESLKNPYRPNKEGKTSAAGPPRMLERPSELTEENIRGFVQRAIDGQGLVDGVDRWWRTKPPPTDRPVRIYADGVYDLLHFGHALQLRQAKLSFPRVHLLVGVCSDALCAAHKNAPSMTHAERCEAVRHCRWADEVLPDAPWEVDQAWIDKYEIDYIAHDELVYPSKDQEDVYGFVKGQGKFLPTRRTPAISTSDLLERIVRGYRDGFFDTKLEKNGQTDLLAADVDWDSDRSVERRQQRRLKALSKKDKEK